MDNVQGRTVSNDNLHKGRGMLSVAAGLVLVGGVVLISASPLAAGSDGATAGVIGKCADTGTGCTADADCEGTCDVAGTTCVADADCPAGACSFTFNRSCSVSGEACSGPSSCPGYCPLSLPTVCTPIVTF